MLIPKIKITLYIALCLLPLFCIGCCCKSECTETQDVAVIGPHYDGGVMKGPHYDSDSTFDNLVIRKDNKVIKCKMSAINIFLIGSQTHKAKFPVKINTQLFLHDTLLQSLDFEMPKNSMLYFYRPSLCSMIYDSTASNIFSERKDKFYLDVQKAMENGVFIDSSRNETACWLMTQMTEENDMRCTHYEGGGKLDICDGGIK